jgi:hypothetical protein
MKFIGLFLFICVSQSLLWQGNLQFNQVKLISIQETVPAGKVWRVDGATFLGGSPICIGSGANTACGQIAVANYSYFADMTYYINGLTDYIYTIAGTSNLNVTTPALNPFPLWLPSGTSLAAGTNMRFLSIVEFNIIP